jgi:hypothetical protein
MKKIVAEFIPIIAFTFFALYTKVTMEFSHTILGKLLAIFVIVLYSLMDKWGGLLVCGIVIFYYQLFAVEGMTTYTTNDIQHETTDAYTTFPASSPNATVLRTSALGSTTENNDIFVKEFQQEHCEQGSLKYKDMDVKSEMAEHVFPEIDYKNDYKKCNPCDSACHYSIVAKKMISEDNMIKSRNSKDDLSWYHQIFGQSTNPMGAIGVVSEPFSIYS